MEAEIQSWANNRAPPVPEMFFVGVDTTSFYTDRTFTKKPFSSPEDSVETISITTNGMLSVPDLNQEIAVVKVTTTGSFSVINLGTQTTIVNGYFEDALTQELESVGVTITSIVVGVVQYETVTYANSSTNANIAISQIQSFLCQTSTMASIYKISVYSIVGSLCSRSCQ